MAGLAAPAVMGMLASRQVLGAVPYQCTISGQISGNASLNGPDTGAGCGLKDGINDWSLTKDSSPGNQTLQALGLSDVYYYKKISGTHYIVQPSYNGAQRATLYQIFRLDPHWTSPPSEFEYGKRALLLWHNASKYPNDYPLSPADAISLFNALVTGGTFSGTTGAGSFFWGTAEIKLYIDLLYH